MAPEKPILWFWFSVAISVLGVIASVIGIVSDVVYANETPNWAAQAVGQDFVNALIAYPLLYFSAHSARRGSLRGQLIWLGVLVYSVYTYAIYSFSVTFGPLFLLYVVVFGLSIYALIGAMTSVDADSVKERFLPSAPTKSASGLLIGVATAFYILWLSEVVPGMIANEPPPSLVEAGLATNPVHVLDMAVFLPSLFIAGQFLRRRRPWGYVLGPMVLVALILLSLGIIVTIPVLAARGEPAPWFVAIGIGAVAAALLLVLMRLLAAAHSDRSRPSR